MLFRLVFVTQRQQRTHATAFLVFLLPSLTLPAINAELVWDQQHFDSFAMYQHDSQSAATADALVPMHLQISQNCAFEADSGPENNPDAVTPSVSSLVAVVSWDEAIAAGCYSYAQFAQNLHEAGIDSRLGLHGIIFGSAIESDDVHFGSPVVEPYGDITHTDSKLFMTLTSASTVRLLLSDITRPSADNITLQLMQEPGPWNKLTQATGFKAQKYSFLAVSIILILYTFWEIGLMLCTLTVWNRRMLMYLAAIGYLVVFALLHPYNINNRASQMTIYVFWIIGYLSFTLFIIAWGSMVEKIHTRMVIILKHHRKVHYSAAALVSLSILLKLWAFAAESYQFSVIADAIVVYEIPVVLAVQTILLCFLIVSFLRRTFEIAISRHTKVVLRNVAILCVVALLGCLCMFALGITLFTPARYTTQGYIAIVILYSLGQCMLFIAIFGALWVRDHAKRTRPMFNRHEYYVDVDAQHHIRNSTIANLRPRSDGAVRVDSIFSINDEPAYQLSELSSQRYQITRQQVEHINDFSPEPHSSAQGSRLSDTCVTNCVGNDRNSIRTTIQNTFDSMASTRVLPEPPIRSLSTAQGDVKRKFSQIHAYVPLEPASTRIMQDSVVIL